MNVEFSGIPKEVLFNVKDIIVSQNIADSVGLSKPIDSVTDWLGKIGIKI